MTTEAQDRLRRYVSDSLHYLENAQITLGAGDAGKASELLWGSMAEALQAVATLRGTHISNHRGLRYFAANVAKELEDSSIIEDFQRAEVLHSNFYEVELEPQDVALAMEPIRRVVTKLLALIPQQALREERGDSHA